MSLITAKNLVISFTQNKNSQLHKPLDFQFDRGFAYVLAGPNGIGKTSLLRLFAGESVPFSGEYFSVINACRIAFVPQVVRGSFHFPMSLYDVLNLVPLVREQRDTEEQLVQDLGLRGKLHVPWNTASGGEKQKTLIIQALRANPDLLLLDEPSNHLDKKSQGVLYKFLSQWIHKDKCLVLSSHEQPEFSFRLISVRPANEH